MKVDLPSTKMRQVTPSILKAFKAFKGQESVTCKQDPRDPSQYSVQNGSVRIGLILGTTDHIGWKSELYLKVVGKPKFLWCSKSMEYPFNWRRTVVMPNVWEEPDPDRQRILTLPPFGDDSKTEIWHAGHRCTLRYRAWGDKEEATFEKRSKKDSRLATLKCRVLYTLEVGKLGSEKTTTVFYQGVSPLALMKVEPDQLIV